MAVARPPMPQRRVDHGLLDDVATARRSGRSSDCRASGSRGSSADDEQFLLGSAQIDVPVKPYARAPGEKNRPALDCGDGVSQPNARLASGAGVPSIAPRSMA
jgi:hypothetical protein